MSDSVFLLPVMALILWTCIIWVCLYATRLPAMRKARMNPQQAKSPNDNTWKNKLPESVNWKADNYNHLHEQPTLFYALMLVIVVTQGADMLSLVLAWLYVVLRIFHSLVQTTINHVVARFALFMLASIVLIWLAIKQAVYML